VLRAARHHAPTAIAALAGASLIAWMGLLTFAFTDYELEALPAFHALAGGHVVAFLQNCPAYGGAMVLRAPFALLPGLWGGGDLAVFRAVAVPGLLATVVLAVVLVAQMDRVGRAPWARPMAIALCAANPVALRALEMGHAEELLGASLCVGAMLLAHRGRGLSGAVAIGLAIAIKPWALLGVVPVLICLERGRVRALATAAATAAAPLLPIALLAGHQFTQATTGAAHTGQIFQPWQLWWRLGATGHVVRGVEGVKPHYRAAPEWLSPISHPLIVVIGVGLALLWWYRRRITVWPEPLLLLAFLLLVRCVLDPWDTSYYHLPFLLTLLAWETQARRGLPLLTFLATTATWTTFELVPHLLPPDGQSLAYLAWALPLAGLLALRVYAPERFGRVARPVAAVAGARLPALARIATGRTVGAVS
jgi:hypothetical protein